MYSSSPIISGINVHQDANLVPIQLESENYLFENKSIPALTASASENDGVTSITITNSNPNNSVALDCDFGVNLELIDSKIVTGKKITDYNDFWKKREGYHF